MSSETDSGRQEETPQSELETLRAKVAEYEARDASAERLHERRARIILDEMYQFVGLLDAEGNLVEVNKAALKGGGIDAADILGKPFWHAHWWQVSAETAEQCRQDCMTVIEEQRFLRREVDVYGELGGQQVITIDFSLKPVRDADGGFWMVAEGRNITEPLPDLGWVDSTAEGWRSRPPRWK